MLQQLPATRLFLTSLLQSPRCELFLPATSKPPSHKRRREKDRQQVDMTEGCSLSYTLLSQAYVHHPPPPSGEKHKLDITARKKVIFILWQALSVQSYFRRMLSSAAIHNISSFIQEEHKRLETTSTKKCSSPGELAVIFLMCL